MATHDTKNPGDAAKTAVVVKRDGSTPSVASLILTMALTFGMAGALGTGQADGWYGGCRVTRIAQREGD